MVTPVLVVSSSPESLQVNRAGGSHGDGLQERGFSFSLLESDWLRSEWGEYRRVELHVKKDKKVGSLL